MFFDCQCDCEQHTESINRISSLKNGHSKSCGCIKFNNPNTVEDLSGKKFYRLTVICRDIERDKKDYEEGKKGTHWLCSCDCGNPELVSVTGYQLKSGHTRSCGCYASEQIAKRNKKYTTKINHCIEKENTVLLFDESNNECIVDKEDYAILKRWYWHKVKKKK